IPISVENDQELLNYQHDTKEILRNAIGQHLYDEPTDMQEGEVFHLEFLQPCGNSNAVYYYHPNHLSSTMYVTDMQQSVVQSFLYAPYGEIISEYNTHAMGEAFPKYSFNAKELDEETGMYYYEARYYAPPTFISRDPLMSEKPWLTPYHYCSNNPVGKVDPTGLFDTKSEAKQYKKENHITGKVKHDGQSWSIQDKKNNVSYYKDNSDNYLVGKGADGVVKSYLAVAPKQGKTSTQKSNNKGQGWGVSLDVNLSWATIGYSFEVGFVQDASGNAGVFYSHGTSAGFEASIGLNGFWIPNSNFKLNDFEGQSMSVNVSTPYVISVSVITDYSREAEKDYYFNNYGGIKVGVGEGVGVSISHTKTYLIKSNPNVGRLEKIYDSNYFRTGGMK
ncbi:MAG: RHS repeat-associated core domain-containing protein, partial [Bacteroidales bacterium]|nr:RHS repeat-associated core domain-containing protein [Bacteroidales bacterium]